ncbi:unnamed protein product [Prorocentrum cordatum]|uniref:Uncharacterized protein n=1 Tax=Prorocentrum cordatum TaxID=2364126 RepID=A0ABN9UVE2_9DINO|nr:unnamed protein product [Polarella glacialis]
MSYLRQGKQEWSGGSRHPTYHVGGARWRREHAPTPARGRLTTCCLDVDAGTPGTGAGRSAKRPAASPPAPEKKSVARGPAELRVSKHPDFDNMQYSEPLDVYLTVLRLLAGAPPAPRDTRRAGGLGAAAGGAAMAPSEAVERFLRENDVDERAAAALRAADPKVQAETLERGNLTDCMNPSAALMARIRGAQGVSSGGGGGCGLSEAELQGKPEDVWARICMRNNISGGGSANSGLGAGMDPIAAAQYMALQQHMVQQQMAMHQYMQQMAIQQQLAMQQQLMAQMGQALPGTQPAEQADSASPAGEVGQLSAAGLPPVQAALPGIESVTQPQTMPGGLADPTGSLPPLGQQPLGQLPPLGQQPLGQLPPLGQQPLGQPSPLGQQPLGQLPPLGQQPLGQLPPLGQQPLGQLPPLGQQPLGQQPLGPLTLSQPSLGQQAPGQDAGQIKLPPQWLRGQGGATGQPDQLAQSTAGAPGAAQQTDGVDQLQQQLQAIAESMPGNASTAPALNGGFGTMPALGFAKSSSVMAKPPTSGFVPY